MTRGEAKKWIATVIALCQLGAARRRTLRSYPARDLRYRLAELEYCSTARQIDEMRLKTPFGRAKCRDLVLQGYTLPEVATALRFSAEAYTFWVVLEEFRRGRPRVIGGRWRHLQT